MSGTCCVLLKGDFDWAHYEGDNSKMLATDTMKNTVYSVARTSKATSMEEYAKELVDFLLGRNSQVSSAEVHVESVMWKRLTVDGKPHPDSFMRGSGELQNTSVERAQGGEFAITSGLENLVILKTANSAFEGFIKESLTTLKDTDDRLFGTALAASWQYTANVLDFDVVRTKLREAMLKTFAGHISKSVQGDDLCDGRERARSGAAHRRDPTDDAEQALPSSRSFAFRAGQSK